MSRVSWLCPCSEKSIWEASGGSLSDLSTNCLQYSEKGDSRNRDMSDPDIR